jgi:hypothetical protein
MSFLLWGEPGGDHGGFGVNLDRRKGRAAGAKARFLLLLLWHG